MRFSSFITSVLASTAIAAPAYPQLDSDVVDPRSLEIVSKYFNLLASKSSARHFTNLAPECDLSKAQMPIAPEALPPVSEGLSLAHVSVGRGTQNYTCDAGNATAVPEAAGAVASLFNVSCIAASYPDLLDLLPGVALKFDLPAAPLSDNREVASRLGPSSAAFSGDHFFHDGKTPYFHLQEDGERIGDAYCALNSSTPAPQDAAVGPEGEAAVGWLKLLAGEGTTDDIREVYRVTTAGGTAPANCGDLPETFQVQYAAAYWFFAGPEPPSEDADESDD